MVSLPGVEVGAKRRRDGIRLKFPISIAGGYATDVGFGPRGAVSTTPLSRMRYSFFNNKQDRFSVRGILHFILLHVIGGTITPL